MNGFSRLAAVEARLFVRERAGLLAVFGLPVALVIGFGLIPGFSETHVLHIYAKLGVNDRAAAVATGFERGLLPRP